MKLNLNKYERVAGMFVLIACFGFVITLLSVAVKQGWFEAKIDYVSEFVAAEGLHAGSSVQIMGLKAGAVDSVELTDKNTILVHYYILAKFKERVRKDSTATLIRPFIIGERVVDVSPGSAAVPVLEANQTIPSQESTDIMTLLSGRSMGNYLQTFSDLLAQFNSLASAFVNKDRAQSIVTMIDRLDPLVRNLNAMSVEVSKVSRTLNKDEKLEMVLSNVLTTTKQINAVIPEVREHAPHLVRDMTTLVTNLSELTTEFKSVTPALSNIDLPRVSRRAVEALDEAVVLMKAMQKSFIVRSNVQEVREEEAKSRQPASVSTAPAASAPMTTPSSVKGP